MVEDRVYGTGHNKNNDADDVEGGFDEISYRDLRSKNQQLERI